MVKNLVLLAALTWVSLVYAQLRVEKENLDDAQGYKMSHPSHEQEAKRALAGEKIKKKKWHQEERSEPKSGPDSEVRYWQYSE
ncbi:MAG: hypothetical protein AB7I27_13135 [Bacteriovoracaceae bacterium]